MNSQPCFGRLVEINQSADHLDWDTDCITCLSCDVLEECRTASGCFEKFHETDTWYHEKYCLTCNLIRRCIYQVGMQIIEIGGEIIRSRPAGAPDCFAYYYGLTGDRTHDPREPGCEDMCRSFTNCIKATHSAINLLSQRHIRKEPQFGNTQPEKPRPEKSRFDVIELEEDQEQQERFRQEDRVEVEEPVKNIDHAVLLMLAT